MMEDVVRGCIVPEWFKIFRILIISLGTTTYGYIVYLLVRFDALSFHVLLLICIETRILFILLFVHLLCCCRVMWYWSSCTSRFEPRRVFLIWLLFVSLFTIEITLCISSIYYRFIFSVFPFGSCHRRRSCTCLLGSFPTNLSCCFCHVSLLLLLLLLRILLLNFFSCAGGRFRRIRL